MSGRPIPSRRTVLRGAAVAPVACLGLTACSTDSGRATSAAPTVPVELGSAGEVPKGATKLFTGERIVVTHADDGTYKAFSTVCTHAQCPINTLEGTELICSCHGSKFDATTGQVLHDPATVPLPEVPVTVKGGKLVAGPEA
ncbi:Rieske (2Fe-2S) protein [Streptomyces sp. NPDC058001]|uniref:Rieske (2Fe-2S) protein n=1 Tax=Streptomyces sp. NPDC058001 TaxID=3346300 RepID=UPI0036F168E9